jgi:predicted Fe-Mo cluster-binding NifX family protein
MKKSIIILGLFIFLGSVLFAQVRQVQFIAVASLDRTEKSQVSDRAARAPYYLLFDESGKLLEVIVNPFYDSARSAGPKVANLLVGKNVTIVVAEDFGSKMIAALNKEGINYYKASGIVKEAVEELIRSNQF